MMEVAGTMRSPPGLDDLEVQPVTTQPMISVAELYEMLQARKKEEALGVQSLESMCLEKVSVPATLHRMNCEPLHQKEDSEVLYVENGRVSGHHSKHLSNGFKVEDHIACMLEAVEASKVSNKVSNVRSPNQGRKTIAKHECEQTITTVMGYLQGIDPDRVVLVRRIKNLGFGSSERLRAHYSKFGKVEAVLVAHSHVKARNAGARATRVRPASIGFLVMCNREDASDIINHALEHTVDGITIQVEVFKLREMSYATCGGD